MSDVDHRAEMLEALDGAKLAATELMSARFLATAQVHATALLAEQQRIANLLTVTIHDEKNLWRDVAGGAPEFDAADPKNATHLAQWELIGRSFSDIAKVLGIS